MVLLSFQIKDAGYILLFEERIYLLLIIFTMPRIETAAGHVEEHLTNFLNGVDNPDHMKVEQLRINTFGTWPSGRKNWPSKLANAGFYYIPQKDETKCFVCDITIKGSEWQKRQDVLLKHKTANPLCPYAQGTYQNHVPLQTREQRKQNKPYLHQKPDSTIMNTAIRHPESESGSDLYPIATSRHPVAFEPTITTAGDQLPPVLDFLQCMKSEQARLETFARWPNRAAISGEALAKAGFFYTLSADRVQCAFCENVLENWEAGENALEEHRRHFPRCRFVLGLDVGNEPIPRIAVVETRQPITPIRDSPEVSLYFVYISNENTVEKMKKWLSVFLLKRPNTL